MQCASICIMQRSKLATFMAANQITVARLAELSGRSERHIYYLRRGGSPQLQSALAVLRGCRRATKKHVDLHDLFDIEAQMARKAS